MGSARSSNRGGTGRGVPTKLPPAVRGPKQLSLAIPSTSAAGGSREPLPSVVHISGWLNIDDQRALVEDFRQWAAPPAGLRHPAMPNGHLMSVQSVCLGWHWRPYVYSRTADDTDGAPVKPLPPRLATLACAAVDAAYGSGTADATRFKPDAAIVNLYSPDAHLGLHQDGEEPSDAPVVTISLGDACVFRMASVERRSGPFVDIEFRSGDLIVFGGPNRRIFHGVPKLLPDTAPDGIGLPPGRLSITVRETGLDDLKPSSST